MQLKPEAIPATWAGLAVLVKQPLFGDVARSWNFSSTFQVLALVVVHLELQVPFKHVILINFLGDQRRPGVEEDLG